jgi:hypothetical protein
LDRATKSLLTALLQFEAARAEAHAFEKSTHEARKAGVNVPFTFERLVAATEQEINDTIGTVRASVLRGSQLPVSMTPEGTSGIQMRILIAPSMKAHAPVAARTVPRFEDEASPSVN